METVNHSNLSAVGRWAPGQTYTVEDIANIVSHATALGIRIVPEIDMPSHTYSWGLAFPGITAACPSHITADIGRINDVPLNPVDSRTWQVVQAVLQEVMLRFPDTHLHIGGDEFDASCWTSTPQIAEYMRRHNLTTEELHAEFEKRVLSQLTSNERTPVVWEEAFLDLPPGTFPSADSNKHRGTPTTVVETWSNGSSRDLALRAGLDVVVAGPYYLDRQVPVDGETGWFWLDTWAQMYGVDPAAGAYSGPGAGRLLGGEASMWTEQVSALNLHARVWPRACAIAERLWSPAETNNASAAAQRLAVHRCRMAARGVPIGPIWSDYCSADAALIEVQANQEYSISYGLMATIVFACMIFGGLSVYGAMSYYAAVAKDAEDAASYKARIATATAAASLAPASLLSTESTPLLLNKDANGQVATLQGDMAPVSESSNGGAVPTAPYEQNNGGAAAGAAAAAAAAGGNADAAAAVLAVAPMRTRISERLESLDVMRGFTVALMVFVDDCGAAFPPIDHTPWDGISLADFVMPSFDFMVGVSIAIAFRRFDLGAAGSRARRWPALKKATWRFIKIFVIGVATQGGIDFMVYDLAHIRIMGILQRVAVCYYAVALMEIYLPRSLPPPQEGGSTSTFATTTTVSSSISSTTTTTNTATDTATTTTAAAAAAATAAARSSSWRKSTAVHQIRAFLRPFVWYKWHWACAAVLLGSHTAIMYGLDVPPAYGEKCGRGVLTPACNAATYVDSLVLSIPHMYFPSNGGDAAGAGVTFQRLPECSSCSPGLCTAPDNAPVWCFTGPFDPEGLVSSLNAILSTVIGVHYGHVLRQVQDPDTRTFQWILFGVLQVVLGLILHYSGVVLMNTDLYSISYTLVSGGAAGLFLAATYILVDRAKRFPYLWRPFKYMGMNAISMYLLAEGGIIDWALTCFYWDEPQKNLRNILWPTGVYWGQDDNDRPAHPTYDFRIMIWCIAYIALWAFVAYEMFKRKMFIRI